MLTIMNKVDLEYRSLFQNQPVAARAVVNTLRAYGRVARKGPTDARKTQIQNRQTSCSLCDVQWAFQPYRAYDMTAEDFGCTKVTLILQKAQRLATAQRAGCQRRWRDFLSRCLALRFSTLPHGTGTRFCYEMTRGLMCAMRAARSDSAAASSFAASFAVLLFEPHTTMPPSNEATAAGCRLKDYCSRSVFFH